jgi:hypothetical protein
MLCAREYQKETQRLDYHVVEEKSQAAKEIEFVCESTFDLFPIERFILDMFEFLFDSCSGEFSFVIIKKCRSVGGCGNNKSK